MDTRYDIRDLALARTNAVRFAKKHPDLAGFHAARFRALALAFGIPENAELSEFGHGPLEALAASSIRTLVELESPFSSFLEAPKSGSLLHTRFGAAINAGIRQTERAIEELLTEVLAEVHGIRADHTVGDEDLQEHGFDPSARSPDELDYF